MQDDHVLGLLRKLEVQIVNSLLFFLRFFLEAVVGNVKKFLLFFNLFGKEVNLLDLLAKDVVVVFLDCVQLFLLLNDQLLHLGFLRVDLFLELCVVLFDFVYCLYHSVNILSLFLVTCPKLIHLLFILSDQVLKLHDLLLVLLN